MQSAHTIEVDAGAMFGEKYDIIAKKEEWRREWQKASDKLRGILIASEEERGEKLAKLYAMPLTDEELNEEIELLDMLEDDVMSGKLSPFEWDPDLMMQEGNPDAMPFHPAANLLPRMSRDELEQLTNDIATNGLRVPITIYQEKTDLGIQDYILDGRHRYEACMLAGVQPRFEEIQGISPRDFTLSANIKRRHLSESQRAMIAAEMANISHGGNRRAQAANMPLGITQKQAAEICAISERTLRSARDIIEHDQWLAEQVKRGDMTVNKARIQIKKVEKARSESGAVQPLDASSAEDPAAACNGVDTPDELSAILSDLTQLGISEERLTGEYARDLIKLLKRLCAIKGWAL